VRLILYLILCAIIVLSQAGLVRSQAAKAELIGEVRDQNGALVQNTKINLTDIATGRLLRKFQLMVRSSSRT